MIKQFSTNKPWKTGYPHAKEWSCTLTLHHIKQFKIDQKPKHKNY